MEIIEQIGSYAGLAAIVGLAILSALYFSQARDVRRLREAEEERAGAAPVRPAPAPGPQRPGAAVPSAGAAAVAPKPGGAQATPAKQPPAPAKAAPAAAPAAAVAQAQPPTAGREGNGQAAGAKEGVTPPADAPAAGAQGASTAPPAREAAEGKPAEGAAAAGASQAPDKPAESTGASPPTPPPAEGTAQRPIPRPAPQRLPAPRPGAARRIPPLPASTQAKPPWYRRLAPRYIVLLVAGVLVLGAGAAFGIATLAGDGGETASDGAGGEPPAGADSSAPLDPSTIEVAVLNGTSISGAAQSVSGTVEQAGFQIGNVANATEQTSAESAVLFAEGARSAAREVGRELGISQLEPVGTDTQDLAGTADVVVVVGADQAE